MEKGYAGIDLHRRRSLIYRMETRPERRSTRSGLAVWRGACFSVLEAVTWTFAGPVTWRLSFGHHIGS